MGRTVTSHPVDFKNQIFDCSVPNFSVRLATFKSAAITIVLNKMKLLLDNVPNNLENEVATVGAPDDCPDAHLTADHDVFASGCQGPKDFPQTNL